MMWVISVRWTDNIHDVYYLFDRTEILSAHVVTTMANEFIMKNGSRPPQNSFIVTAYRIALNSVEPGVHTLFQELD
jgi:hypothetical protein